jgi:hypothetical protein
MLQILHANILMCEVACSQLVTTMQEITNEYKEGDVMNLLCH